MSVSITGFSSLDQTVHLALQGGFTSWVSIFSLNGCSYFWAP